MPVTWKDLQSQQYPNLKDYLIKLDYITNKAKELDALS